VFNGIKDRETFVKMFKIPKYWLVMWALGARESTFGRMKLLPTSPAYDRS
jgi:hypothetical protein